MHRHGRKPESAYAVPDNISQHMVSVEHTDKKTGKKIHKSMKKKPLLCKETSGSGQKDMGGDRQLPSCTMHPKRERWWFEI